MTKEEQLLEYVASEGAPSLGDVRKRGLEPAARRLLQSGKILRGTGAYSMNWTCPNEAKMALARCKTRKARKDLEGQLLKEIALGAPRTQSLAKVMLGTYNGTPNSIGRYP